jgi:hypothetical protein
MKKPPLVNLLFADGTRFVANHRGAFALVPATDRSRTLAQATLAYLTLAGDGGGAAQMRINSTTLFKQLQETIFAARSDAVRTVERGHGAVGTYWWDDGAPTPILTLCRIAFTKRVTRETYRRYGQTQHGKGLGRV